MRGVRTEDERGLEEQLVDDPAATAVEIEAAAMGAIRMLVGETEPQEFRREEGHVRLDRPLPAGIHRVLRGVVADAERPSPPRLHFAPTVPAEAILRLLSNRVDALAA